jgi:hypothetical protein
MRSGECSGRKEKGGLEGREEEGSRRVGSRKGRDSVVSRAKRGFKKSRNPKRLFIQMMNSLKKKKDTVAMMIIEIRLRSSELISGFLPT